MGGGYLPKDSPTITLSCVGHTGQYLPGKGAETEVRVLPSESIASLLKRLDVEKDLFMYALVNEAKVNLTHCLQDGDKVVLVSPLMGG